MLDKPTSQNHQDFRQRYNGTFGWILLPEGKKFVKISGVDSEYTNFVDNKGLAYHVVTDGEKYFEFLPCNRGWYISATGNAYYATRVPARQWHRGMSEHNTALYGINEAENLVKKSMSMAVMHSIFGGEKMAYGFDRYRENNPLSRHFCLSKSHVWFFNQPIGTHEEGKIKLWNNMVYQELLDQINRNKYPLEVFKK